LGFEYFEQEGEEILPDAGEYEPVGKKTARKKSPAPEKLHEPAAPIPDMFPLAVGMLTECWSGKYERQFEAFRQMQSVMGGKAFKVDKLMGQLRDGCDRGARDFLKHSPLPGRPTIEELKAARDK